jgi:predicted phosphoadenosine phosphosulfate sulfurtransferase
VLAIQRGRFKFLPVIDWSNKDVFYYFKEFDLPYHPVGAGLPVGRRRAHHRQGSPA